MHSDEQLRKNLDKISAMPDDEYIAMLNADKQFCGLCGNTYDFLESHDQVLVWRKASDWAGLDRDGKYLIDICKKCALAQCFVNSPEYLQEHYGDLLQSHAQYIGKEMFEWDWNVPEAIGKVIWVTAGENGKPAFLCDYGEGLPSIVSERRVEFDLRYLPSNLAKLSKEEYIDLMYCNIYED
jgi:hypothetical protein